jgi:alkanesulfonate monooxygenase SsuD/methylene tetrahydromethanopterin reductase-like flavin-dependent oxidoreductase (luciferase family)
MAEAARLAEEVGFEVYAVPERHFGAAVSAPEVILPYIAAKTNRIALRWLDVPLLAFNHPIRVAERLATLDVISKGRAQLAAASTADARTLQAFGIDPDDAGRQWKESLEVIVTVLTQDPFEFHGEIWDIPPTHLEPLPYQKPHPPIFVTAADLEAGAKMSGVLAMGPVEEPAEVVPKLVAERARELEALGHEELVLRIDGLAHEETLEAIEQIGKDVIPELAAA